MKKIIIISLVVIVVLVAGFTLFKNGNGNEQQYKILKPEKGEIVDKALAIGKITPRDEIQVKSKIAGIVKKMHVEVGDKIREGELLADITPDPTPLEITEARRTVEIAKVAFDQAKNEYARKKDLLDKNLVSRQEFEQEEMAYQQSRLQMQLSQEKLALIEKGRTEYSGYKVESVVKAPISGTILEKFVNVGDPVVPLTSYQAGTPLFTIADMSDLIFRGTVDEIDVGKVKVNMPVELKIGALPGVVVKGVVSRISPKAKQQDNATLFDIEIAITDTKAPELRAGYSANAEIIIKKVEDVLYVPERLVTFQNDSAFVEVEDTAGLVHKIQIEPGLSDGVNLEVAKGLAVDDKVVERPPKEIK
ncbi:MAG: efflux RND transporter periplasmic adaptor subunit [Calditrichota bacterium]